MTDYVIALDPGQTTGVAVLAAGEVSVYQLDYQQTGDLLFELMSHGPVWEVVCESFTITTNTGKHSQAPWSLEVIGIARYATKRMLGGELTMQTPMNAKKFSTDDKLKKMGWYTPGMKHATDAARHLLLYQASKNRLTPEQVQMLVR